MSALGCEAASCSGYLWLGQLLFLQGAGVWVASYMFIRLLVCVFGGGVRLLVHQRPECGLVICMGIRVLEFVEGGASVLLWTMELGC